LRKENQIVHGLWIGDISRLELLTIHSFVEHGHEFHLWRYEPTPERLPKNVVLRNGNEILHQSTVFRKRTKDTDVGLGAGSYSTFSDLFRAELLYHHGGTWVDMDVMCLRPFDFQEPYVFRGHRVGAVMNVVKCPAESPLFGELLNLVDYPNAESDWLDFTRSFYESIIRNRLDPFIRWDLMPADSWRSIQPFMEGKAQPDPSWYAIHFLNELWNEVRRAGGWYKGQQITARLPDKNHPIPGTTLFEWYQKYNLFRRAWTPVKAPSFTVSKPAAHQPVQPTFSETLHLNVAITSMSLGGAERAVQETLSGLRETKIRSSLFLLHDVEPSYPVDDIPGCRVVRTARMAREEKLRKIGLEVLASSTPAIFAHLMYAQDFKKLAKFGISVIPVVHNSQPAWQDPPEALNQDGIPLVVAVSQSVKNQLIEWGCCKPIIVLRHEVQCERPSPEQAAKDRLAIRRRYNVPQNALLIGMIGQFKAQKMYTRAVRVLRALRDYLPARLMILGGWDHEWGSGRAAYTAVCQQALESNVMADLIMPGPVHPIDPYYSAFDVFLNTSVYEGLSISVLEAVARGCPVVSAAAGGNEEALSDNDRLVRDTTSTDDYVDAVLEVAARGRRVIPPMPAHPELVPRLWAMLGRHGVPRSEAIKPAAPSVLVVIENLNIGGPQRSLTNLLTHWPASVRIAVVVLDTIYSGAYLSELEQANIPVVGLRPERSIIEKCQRMLELAERLDVTTIAFWNVPAAFKLACAKVLEVSQMRLVDVSPGPTSLKELKELEELPRRMSLSVEEYCARVDCFVTKFNGGVPSSIPSHRTRVVPNGVPIIDADASTPENVGRAVIPIGTCSRIVPRKRIEYLIDMLDILTQRVPDVTLTIVGGSDPGHEEYAKFISDKIVRAGLDNIEFTGPLDDVRPLLQSFSVFVMVSDEQGCPNASLEAMAFGVPVVANASGGTAEQIEHGVNGFLVDGQSPRSMADAVEKLIRNEPLRRRFAAAARQKVARDFSMGAMVEKYLEAFGCHQPPKEAFRSPQSVGSEAR
jgi:glycosyltransferase involved in cell wall biosynthesis